MPATQPPRVRGLRPARTLLIGAVVLTALVGTAPLSSAQTPGPGAAVPIPLTSLGELSSLSAEATLSAAGSLRGTEMSGDLTVAFASNDAGDSQIDITGSLLGPVAAQVGGKLAQVGSRLIDAAAKKLADEFFNAFNARVAPSAAGAGAPQPAAGVTVWVLIAAAIAVIVALLFVMR